eukprot:TRINITY_DN20840_c0_g1_i1.p1 TRINITY_DN20840_c0_g1~~TRINITY_DN20840_c0_g1_i1.p1  ORF type:complete len:366 (-),score=55.07 TRINITY_DN20840_c0_g1_i1:31-1128(-)
MSLRPRPQRLAPGGAPRTTLRPKVGGSSLRRANSAGFAFGDRAGDFGVEVAHSRPRQLAVSSSAPIIAAHAPLVSAASRSPAHRAAVDAPGVTGDVAAAFGDAARRGTGVSGEDHGGLGGRRASRRATGATVSKAAPASVNGAVLGEGGNGGGAAASSAGPNVVKTGKLSAEAASLPPWSCPLNSSIRYQPTTLVWRVDKLPQGLAKAAKELDSRRYQPTSAEMGLNWRLRDAVPGGAGATHERIGAGTPAAREGAKTPPVGRTAYPTWWGLPGGVGGERPTYEEIGEWFGEKGLIKEEARFDRVPLPTDCKPRLDGRYDHSNPFIAQFGRRGPGGLVVCDVSVCGKGGPGQRDPNCPPPVSRGW